MSTRCQIGFLKTTKSDPGKPEVLIYRHSDGYPDGEAGVEAVMREFFPKFIKQRSGDDMEYMSAQFLAHMIRKHQEWAHDLAEEGSRRTWEYLGYGICSDFHGDIEYYYAVSPIMLPVGERNMFQRSVAVQVDVYERIPFGDGDKVKLKGQKPLHTWTFNADDGDAS